MDDKGRMAVPSRHRAPLSEKSDGKLIVTVATHGKCALLYQLSEFEKVEQKFATLETLSEHTSRLIHLIVGYAEDCEMDSQGRIMIPEPIRRLTGLGKRVAFVGVLTKFEVWDEDVWHQRVANWIAEETSPDKEKRPPEMAGLSF